MDIKRLYFDRNIERDNSKVTNTYTKKNGMRGHAWFKDGLTGETLFEDDNKVIIPGSIFTACKHAGIDPTIKLPSYNKILGLDNTLTESNFVGEIICLFAVGIDGGGEEGATKYEVDYTKWITPDALVPFKYELAANDLSVSDRSKYFGRKDLPDEGRIAYYFKKFETEPNLVVQRIDGTPIDDTVYTSENTMEAETFLQLKLKVTNEDCRNFFFATTGINDAHINTISILTAWKKTIDGYDYYQNIQPLTKLNITKEYLIDLTKGLDILYHIYY